MYSGSARVHNIFMYEVIFSSSVWSFLSFTGVLTFMSRYLLKNKQLFFFLGNSLYQAFFFFVSAVWIVGSRTHICTSSSVYRKSRHKSALEKGNPSSWKQSPCWASYEIRHAQFLTFTLERLFTMRFLRCSHDRCCIPMQGSKEVKKWFSFCVNI